MKKQFTKTYLMSNSDFYDSNLSFINNKRITINDILNSEISLDDKVWFVVRSCELTVKQKRALALKLAEIVSPIYEEKYPDDKRVRDCIKAIKAFNKGKITRKQLWEARNAAAASASSAASSASAYSAYSAAYSASAYSASAYSAYSAAYSASAAYSVSYAVHYASSAAASAKYQKKILQTLNDVFKTLKK